MRISKTTLINMNTAQSVQPYFGGTLHITLKNGLTDYISRKYLRDFKEYLGI